MSDGNSHWTEDPLWTDALQRYYELRDSGQKTLVIDVAVVEDFLFSGRTPAYKFMEAMSSVQALEEQDGHRGAPRLICALLSLLSDVCAQAKKENLLPDSPSEKAA